MYGISLPADPAGEDALAEWAVFVLWVDVQRVHGGQAVGHVEPLRGGSEGGQRGIRGGPEGGQRGVRGGSEGGQRGVGGGSEGGQRGVRGGSERHTRDVGVCVL